MAAPLTPPRSNNNTPLRDLTADQQAQPETHSPTAPRPHTDDPLSHGTESDIDSPGDSESEEDELVEGEVEEIEEMEGLEEEDLDDGQGALQDSESDGDGIVIDQDQFLAVQEQMGFNTGRAGGGTVNLMREKALSQQRSKKRGGKGKERADDSAGGWGTGGKAVGKGKSKGGKDADLHESEIVARWNNEFGDVCLEQSPAAAAVAT